MLPACRLVPAIRTTRCIEVGDHISLKRRDNAHGLIHISWQRQRQLIVRLFVLLTCAFIPSQIRGAAIRMGSPHLDRTGFTLCVHPENGPRFGTHWAVCAQRSRLAHFQLGRIDTHIAPGPFRTMATNTEPNTMPSPGGRIRGQMSPSAWGANCKLS